MAKKVLFQPEDFDKPQNKSSKKKLAWGVGICAALALASIGGYALLAPKTLEATDEVATATSSVNDISDNSQARTEDAGSVEVSDEANVNTSEIDNNEKQTKEVQDDEGGRQKTGLTYEPRSTGNPTVIETEDVSLEQEAMKVIRGDYGDGKARINRLGSRYKAIQNRVNQLKRKGVF